MAETMSVSSVTIGTPRPLKSARFYQRLLGWELSAVDPPPEGVDTDAGWAQVAAPDGTAGLRRINLEYEQEYTPPVWPSVPGQQRVTTHLDIPTGDLEGSMRRAVEAGARPAEFQPQDDVRVLLDPAGHPFCLFRSG